jgi:hypothetical protein
MMTDEQIDRLCSAVEGLTAGFERMARPVIVVTDDPNCQMVRFYQERGYPVYFPAPSKPQPSDAEIFARGMEWPPKAARTESS